jgi:hypothetical protein
MLRWFLGMELHFQNLQGWIKRNLVFELGHFYYHRLILSSHTGYAG